MTPTPSDLRAALAKISASGTRAMAVALKSASSPDEAKAVLNDVLPSLVRQYGSAASTTAARWYDLGRAAREIKGSFKALPANLNTTAGSVGSSETLTSIAVGPLYSATPDWAFAQTLVAGGLQRRIANYARATITHSSVADPKARGWQRVGDGATCEFCAMLLGRGAVYIEATADFQAHDHCACTAAPVWR